MATSLILSPLLFLFPLPFSVCVRVCVCVCVCVRACARTYVTAEMRTLRFVTFSVFYDSKSSLLCACECVCVCLGGEGVRIMN
jgi:hypothetical protein